MFVFIELQIVHNYFSVAFVALFIALNNYVVIYDCMWLWLKFILNVQQIKGQSTLWAS